MSIYQNIQKSKQIQSEIEKFMACGGRINELPRGFSGENNTNWNGSKLKKDQQAMMRKIMAVSVANAKSSEKQDKRKQPKAPREDIQTIKTWLSKRVGRGAAISRLMGKNPNYMANVVNKGCSIEKFEQIKLAMQMVEIRENNGVTA